MADAYNLNTEHGLRGAVEGEPGGTARRLPRSRVAGAGRGRPRAGRRCGRGGRPSRSPSRRGSRSCRAGGSTDLARERGVQPARRDVRARGRRGPRDALSRLHRQRRRRRRCADLLTHEQVALGLSDAGAHVDQLCDAPLPTDLLGTWVRDRGVLPLEQAVRKLTGEPADLFGFVRPRLPPRGELGRRVRVRSGDRRHRARSAGCATSPPDARAAHRRGADRRAARARQRHADPRATARSSTRRRCDRERRPEIG